MVSRNPVKIWVPVWVTRSSCRISFQFRSIRSFRDSSRPSVWSTSSLMSSSTCRLSVISPHHPAVHSVYSVKTQAAPYPNRRRRIPLAVATRASRCGPRSSAGRSQYTAQELPTMCSMIAVVETDGVRGR